MASSGRAIESAAAVPAPTSATVAAARSGATAPVTSPTHPGSRARARTSTWWWWPSVPQSSGGAESTQPAARSVTKVSRVASSSGSAGAAGSPRSSTGSGTVVVVVVATAEVVTGAATVVDVTAGNEAVSSGPAPSLAEQAPATIATTRSTAPSRRPPSSTYRRRTRTGRRV